MKSFVFALLLLLSVIVFVSTNAGKTIGCIDEMLALANDLPQTAEEFQNANPDIEKTVHSLVDLWDREFPILAFTAGYENTDRCDEAIGALSVHFKNQSAPDFAVALSEFCDGLLRLRILEGVRWESIF